MVALSKRELRGGRADSGRAAGDDDSAVSEIHCGFFVIVRWFELA